MIRLNIVSTILAQARRQPAALAICMPGAARPTMSYGRLAESLNNVAQQAHAAGLKRGDTVAIDIADAVQHLLLTLGLMRIGIVTLSGGDRCRRKFRFICRSCASGACAMARRWMTGKVPAETVMTARRANARALC